MAITGVKTGNLNNRNSFVIFDENSSLDEEKVHGKLISAMTRYALLNVKPGPDAKYATSRDIAKKSTAYAMKAA